MRYRTLLAVAAPLVIADAGHAFAHAHLRSAAPAVDSTVTQAPRDVTITFSEGVEPLFSTIEVTAADAKRVDQGKPHLVAGDDKRLAIDLAALTPGTYTVTWHATSVDTHKTEGTYHFTLAASDASGITVEHPWARASAGEATTGAVYLTVTDNGRPDRLTGASTPAAAEAGLHESSEDNGVMKMRPLDGIALDPGKPVAFKPNGYHVMLTGLKAPLHAGDTFPLTLTFEHAKPVTVEVKVEATGMHDHSGMAGMHDHMGRSP